jgi:hypothetical protein
MERLNTESSRAWLPPLGSSRLARIHYALSLQPSPPEASFSIATELSLLPKWLGPPIPRFSRAADYFRASLIDGPALARDPAERSQWCWASLNRRSRGTPDRPSGAR